MIRLLLLLAACSTDDATPVWHSLQFGGTWSDGAHIVKVEACDAETIEFLFDDHEWIGMVSHNVAMSYDGSWAGTLTVENGTLTVAVDGPAFVATQTTPYDGSRADCP